MNIIDATKGYEAWLAKQIDLLEGDLKHKHEQMAADALSFLRATYYRWAQVWPETAPRLASGLRVLAVGDLHVENFGTWRDSEGRLVWGVNDLDEAAELPFTLDLTRVAVSAVFASRHRGLSATHSQLSSALLEGYRASLREGGSPFVLEERHAALRSLLIPHMKDAAAFWTKLSQAPEYDGRRPKTAIRLLMRLLPSGVGSLKIIHRIAGLGSLGRQRLTVIGQFEGGYIAREVKQLAPPASVWAGIGDSRAIRYGELLRSAVRCADPFLIQRGHWVGRRLSPSNSRVELYQLPGQKDILHLMQLMGAETANVHLGSASRKRLSKSLDAIPASAFAQAVRDLERCVARDWKAWKSR